MHAGVKTHSSGESSCGNAAGRFGSCWTPGTFWISWRNAPQCCSRAIHAAQVAIAVPSSPSTNVTGKEGVLDNRVFRESKSGLICSFSRMTRTSGLKGAPNQASASCSRWMAGGSSPGMMTGAAASEAAQSQ